MAESLIGSAVPIGYPDIKHQIHLDEPFHFTVWRAERPTATQSHSPPGRCMHAEVRFSVGEGKLGIGDLEIVVDVPSGEAGFSVSPRGQGFLQGVLQDLARRTRGISTVAACKGDGDAIKRYISASKQVSSKARQEKPLFPGYLGN